MIVEGVAWDPVRRMLHLRGFDVSLAEDVLQEVALRMAADDFRNLRAFRGQSEKQLRAFLRTTAVHLTQDLLRKWERTRRHENHVQRDWPELPTDLTHKQARAVLAELQSGMSERDALRFRTILAAQGLLTPQERPADQGQPPSERTLRRWKLELFRKYFRGR